MIVTRRTIVVKNRDSDGNDKQDESSSEGRPTLHVEQGLDADAPTAGARPNLHVEQRFDGGLAATAAEFARKNGVVRTPPQIDTGRGGKDIKEVYFDDHGGMHEVGTDKQHTAPAAADPPPLGGRLD